MNERLPLFAFGTLRSGQCNHDRLHGRYDRRLQARLYGFGYAGPMMIARDGDGCVLGELFFLPEEQYDAILRACDDLEGIAPGATAGPAYARIQVTVATAEGEFPAWCYVRPDSA